MWRSKLGRIAAVVLAALALAGCGGKGAAHPRAQRGALDLSQWSLEEEPVALDGDWAFYWDQAIDPGGFDGSEKLTGYYPVPSYWTEYEGLRLPSRGRATYRLRVVTGGGGMLGIKTPEIYTQFRLWVNGALVASSESASGGPLYLKPDVYDFHADGREVEIVLQVSNESHVYAGVGQSLQFGSTGALRRAHGAKAAVDIVYFSVCFFAAFYHLFLHAFQRGRRELVFFCLLCVAAGLRALLCNETLLMQLFPRMPFLLGSRLVTLTIPACVVSMLLYIREMYKEDVPPRAYRALLAANAAYAALVLFAGSFVYSHAFMVYLYVVGASCLLGLFILVRVVARKRRDAYYFLAGALPLAACAAADILVFLRVLQMSYVLPAGLSVFILTQAVLLAKRQADTHRETARLSEELKESLDAAMRTETAFLGAQMKPHFLYNALNTIAECCATEPREAERLILSLSKYLRGTLDFENLGGRVGLKKELELVRAYAAIEMARFDNITIAFDIDESLLDMRLPPLTLQPLVENAIKHGLRRLEAGGSVVVRADRKDGGARFTVEDNGCGMPEEQLSTLLTPRLDKGIGLYNIHTRLMRQYGKGISIQSAAGGGTRVSFDIPFPEEA